MEVDPAGKRTLDCSKRKNSYKGEKSLHMKLCILGSLSEEGGRGKIPQTNLPYNGSQLCPPSNFNR